MDEYAGTSLRAIPQLQRLLEAGQRHALLGYPRDAVVGALRHVLDAARSALRRGEDVSVQPGPLLDRALAALQASEAPSLLRVINATGIVLHTNLGRAPLAAAALAAIQQAAGYCNLEFDLETGARGSRTQGIEPLLQALTGAEAGLAVNNCAAAMLLALSALAGNGEVVVSRGELVEIGGGFRIPDVIRQGGARLVEVGTTNKTRLRDYEQAITPATKVLLKVHQSNFRISGFTEAASLTQLAALAQSRGLLLMHDLGSGMLGVGRAWDATVPDSIAAGVDVVAFSGDKLLGGPQSGLLAGRAAAIDALRKHPLLRAVRLDKLSLAALEATLRLHRDGSPVPALAMMAQSLDQLQARAARLAALLGPIARTKATTGFAGGGTLPEVGLPSVGVALLLDGPERLRALLRSSSPPVVARVAAGRILLDMLTVADAEVEELAASIKQAIAV